MRARLIPVLLLDRRRRLVKTIGFGERTYIGDPFNVIRLFNEKEVDEICVLDIDATADGRVADVGFITELASQCFMPLSYGGGIGPGAPVDALARAGVEKLILGSHAADAGFIRALSADFGSQAVLGCIDYRGGARGAAFTHGGRRPLGRTPIEHAEALAEAGAGEVVLQSIAHDGLRTGMDLDAISEVSAALTIPVIALGGAGEVAQLEQGLAAGASAAASGSAFSVIGRLRAVLITYPTILPAPGPAGP
jgi:cyclase